MSTKVFITGGTGFLGAYIIKELVQKNYAVRAFRRSHKLPFFVSPEIFSRVEWVDGDILDVASLEEAMAGTGAVVHAAAKVSLHSHEKDVMFKTNIEGSANVMNAAIAQGIPRLVHVSSIAALGRTSEGGHVDETKKWQKSRSNTNYAISKHYGEMEAWRAIGEGLRAVIVSPGTILGYGDWHTSSCAIFKTVYDEVPWYTNGINGFVDVEDVARAVVMLMESNVSGEKFIISAENSSFRQLFNFIADEFGKRHPLREATPFLASVAWRWEKIKSMFSGRPSVLTRESAKVALAKTYFDNSKILKAFPGFSFTPLRKTVQKACSLYTAHAGK